jgi:hypothetical protein
MVESRMTISWARLRTTRAIHRFATRGPLRAAPRPRTALGAACRLDSSVMTPSVPAPADTRRTLLARVLPAGDNPCRPGIRGLHPRIPGLSWPAAQKALRPELGSRPRRPGHGRPTAAARETAFDRGRAVLVQGGVHAFNALQVPGPTGVGAEGRPGDAGTSYGRTPARQRAGILKCQFRDEKPGRTVDITAPALAVCARP